MIIEVGSVVMAKSKKNKNRFVADIEHEPRMAEKLAPMMLIAALFGVFVWSVVYLLDPAHYPIRSVKIEGTFDHLDKSNLQTVVEQNIEGGFFNVDIEHIQKKLRLMPWVDQVAIRRVWPETLKINVEEHVPLARWASTGLINAQGRWFQADHDQASMSLPVFNGPSGFISLLTQRYQAVSKTLEPLQLSVMGLFVDQRRAWRIELSNGIELKLGRAAIDERLQRFARVYPLVVTQQDHNIEGIDLRYTNGMAVAWKSAGGQPNLGVGGG